MSISASGSSLHCVGYGSVLCSARQQTTLGLGPPLAGQSRSAVFMPFFNFSFFVLLVVVFLCCCFLCVCLAMLLFFYGGE